MGGGSGRCIRVFNFWLKFMSSNAANAERKDENKKETGIS